jgi:hypothetical protein
MVIGPEFPIRHMVEAFVATFRSLHRTINALGAPNFNPALKASERVAVGTEQILEKRHPVSAHGILRRRLKIATKQKPDLTYRKSDAGPVNWKSGGWVGGTNDLGVEPSPS